MLGSSFLEHQTNSLTEIEFEMLDFVDSGLLLGLELAPEQVIQP